MFIHLGNRKIISDRKTVGIFNAETLRLSEINEWITDNCDHRVKSVALSEGGDFSTSGVSPYTVIKRTSLNKDVLWRRNNE